MQTPHNENFGWTVVFTAKARMMNHKNMFLNFIERYILLCYRIGKSEEKKVEVFFENKKMIYDKKTTEFVKRRQGLKTV